MTAPTSTQPPTSAGPSVPAGHDHDLLHVVEVETPSLGDRSYVLHDGSAAAVIDPQRDVDRILAVLDAEGLELAAVLETHVHNDYVSGGLELAERTGASYHVAAAEEVAFDRVPVRDGDRIAVGALELRAVHTPGHTPTHLSYVVAADGRELAVCTGGGLLFGSVGRTDLISVEATEELTRLQHRSAHRLAEQLGDAVSVLPTHGFGSFCSSGEVTGAQASTIGEERRRNDALRIADEDEFVAELLAGLDAYPAYYAHMAPANRAGPAPADLSPVEAVDVTELRRRLHAGEWVVDLRSRRAYADGHLVGTVNVEHDDSASTHLGWLLPWGTPVTLVADSPDTVAEFQRQLVRIGIDRPAGRASTETALAGPRGRYDVVDFPAARALLATGEQVTLLDTRRALEWADGHVRGAVHVPLHELAGRLDELPEGRLLVHCASGYRASIAASLLARAGRDVVLVDDDVTTAATAGLPWVR